MLQVRQPHSSKTFHHAHPNKTSGLGSTLSRKSDNIHQSKDENVDQSQTYVSRAHNTPSNNKRDNVDMLEKFPSMKCFITSHKDISHNSDSDNGQPAWRNKWSVPWMNFMFGDTEKNNS